MGKVAISSYTLRGSWMGKVTRSSYTSRGSWMGKVAISSYTLRGSWMGKVARSSYDIACITASDFCSDKKCLLERVVIRDLLRAVSYCVYEC